ncbi:MAG: UDP-N-acetylglucosamine 2-epimerase [Cyanobacteriota bacterium]|nr:UDP-N-acetylglucosamine 2-epimerase [Cyanobacteriota bacterium]
MPGAEGRLELGIAVTGMHLLQAYGHTVSEIEAAGLTVVARIPVALDGSSGGAMARAMAVQLEARGGVCEQWQPDLVVVLGGRGEMLAAALAGVHLGIPVAHVHGGERSGTVDESVRHAISKLVHLHLVATEQSRQRLIRMGERPDQIWVTGAPGLDGLDAGVAVGAEARAAWCQAQGFDPGRPLLLVLFHPVLQEAASACQQAEALLQGIVQAAPQAQLLVLAPNSDGGGEAIAQVWQQRLPALGLDHRLITHLPRSTYLEALAVVDALVGNSSSGIIEAASFGLPVVDVGSRQQARERSANVRHADPDAAQVASALRAALAGGRQPVVNVYGDGQAAGRISAILATAPLPPALLAKLNSY